jgi:predicted enzyme related to lactoylglutathione lyase
MRGVARTIGRLTAAVLFAVVGAAPASPLGPDGAPGRSHPGKFIWFDLATDDPAGARAFYGTVFGWTFRPVDNAPASYTLIEGAGGKVGGLFRQSRPAGAPIGSRWISLISVADPSIVAQRARDRGGRVVVAPVAVPGRGTHAVLRDPQGAVFGVLAASGGDPADDPVEDGGVFWLDLFAAEPHKAAAFYSDLIGYESSEVAVGGRKRWLLAAGGIARAGVVSLPPGTRSPGWLPYVLVDDVPSTLARVRENGGRIVVAPRADLVDGRVAVFADPNGGVVGIVDWEAREQTMRRAR